MNKVMLLFLWLINCMMMAQNTGMKFLFKNHKEGYNVYRIPTIIKTASGKLLVFCEGRNSLLDKGDIDIVMKTSADNGNTWSSLKIIWDIGKNTCGNPAPVYDIVTGKIILTATLNNDKVYVLCSKDDGESWEPPMDMTSAVKPDNWKWYASGPVHAVQLEQTSFKNRIVVPCNHTITGINKHISHVIYSDDSGVTWKLGGSVPNEKTDECVVAELANGGLLLNMRNSDRTLPNRKKSISTDGGITWSYAVFDSTLIEPICQGSLLSYSSSPNILLFSNPLHKKKRKNLTLSISYDNGKTWAKQVNICHNKSAYSDMAVLKNGDVICLFETGNILPYGGITTKIISGCIVKK